jgi:hypothetical protein
MPWNRTATCGNRTATCGNRAAMCGSRAAIKPHVQRMACGRWHAAPLQQTPCHRQLKEAS